MNVQILRIPKVAILWTRAAFLFSVISATFTVAYAQEFRPYSYSKISQSQWQTYIELVQKNFAATERDYAGDHLLTYRDAKMHVFYTFTQQGHPAHPAWIAQRLMEKDGYPSMELVGFYAGDERAFNDLYRQFEKLTEQITERARSNVK